MKATWILTVLNVIICVLLLLSIYALLVALGGFAAGVNETPTIVLFFVGVVISAASFFLIRRLSSSKARRTAYLLNTGPALVYGVLLFAAAKLWFSVTRRLFLVPAGFQGQLYVVHAANGAPRPRPYLRKTYLFATDGTLYTSEPPPGLFDDEYSYIYPDGHSEAIRDAGPGTLPDTPENRANQHEVLTYMPTTSSSGAPGDCVDEEIMIGTPAFLLSRRFASPPPEKIHPGICH